MGFVFSIKVRVQVCVNDSSVFTAVCFVFFKLCNLSISFECTCAVMRVIAIKWFAECMPLICVGGGGELGQVHAECWFVLTVLVRL